MKAYILSVIGASLAAALVILLTPEGKGGGIGKHIKLLTSLALLCIITDPFLTFIGSLSESKLDGFKESLLENVSETDPYENTLYESLSKMSADTLETELKNRISKRFGIKKDDLDVNAEYEIIDGTVCFKRIVVTLSGGAIFKNPHTVEAYVKEITGIECKCLL